MILLALLLPATLAGRALPMDRQRLLAWPGYLWLAVMFLALSALVVLELPRLVLYRWAARGAAKAGGGAAPTVVDQGRRLLVARSLAAVAGVTAVGTTAFGVTQALGPPRIVRRRIALAKLPRSMDGFRIAVVSDIHLGPLLGRGHTSRIVDMINRLDADLVTVVGDLVDGSVAELGAAAEPLAQLRSRRGSYFVTGNHEYFSGYREWITEVGSFGLTVLRNRRLEIDGLDLAGVNDATGGSYGDGPDYDAALGGRDPARPVVLLAHQPIQVNEAEKRGVDLQLSGHTHGGQIFPFGYLVRLQQPVLAGYARFGNTQLYVTRGAGFWGPPVRVGAPPDISLVELRAP
jgi:predicted MPP superfamily phosphohydrolase